VISLFARVVTRTSGSTKGTFGWVQGVASEGVGGALLEARVEYAVCCWLVVG